MPGGYRMGGGGGPWWHGYGWPWGPPWAAQNPYWGAPMYGFPAAGAPPYQFAPQYSRELEINFLKEQAQHLEKTLEEVKKRLRELGEA